MIFSKNIRNIAVLDSELIRLKALYVKALETKNGTAVKALRKTIKLLKMKMVTLTDSTIASG